MNGIGRTGLGGCLFAGLALLFAGPRPTPADDKKLVVPEPTVAELIEDLGHPLYATREKASRELWKRGEAARAAAAVAAKSSDPEVARRAGDLLEKFEWGVFPDTPADVLKLLKEYRTADPARQKAAVVGLVRHGRRGRSVLRAALAKATPADVKAELGKEPDASPWRVMGEFLAGAVRREALAQLLEDRRDEVDELLALNVLGASPAGLADYAAYQYLRGTLPAAVAAAEAARGAGGPTGETARLALVYLYRAQGEWKKARAGAADLPRVPNEPPAIDMLLEEEGAWAELARRDIASAANLPEALRITLLRLSGQKREAEARAAGVAREAGDFASRDDVQHAAYALLLNQRATEATALLIDKHQNLGLLSELLIAQMRFKEALELVVKGHKPGDAAAPTEEVEFDLRRSRLLFVLGRKADAVQLFGQVAESLRVNPEGGRVLAETITSIRSLLRAEMRLGLRDLAAEHAAIFLASDDRRFRDQLRWGESPFEILFDTDARAAESLFWVLRNAGVPGDAAGTSMRRVRELLGGTVPKGAADGAVRLLRDPAAADGPKADRDEARRTPQQAKIDRRLAEAAVLRGAKRWEEAEAAYVAAADATLPGAEPGEEEPDRPRGARSWVYGTSDDLRPWVELGDFLADRGRHRDAARRLEAGWKRYPDQPILLYLCGRATVRAGDAAEGQRRIELAHWVALGNERARGRFLDELVRRGAAAAAKRETDLLLHACWSRDGYFGNVMNQASRASALNGDFALAERCVQRSLFVLLKVPGVHFVEAASYMTVPQNMAVHRARALLAEGRTAEAVAQAKAVLAVQPGHTEVAIGLVPGLEKAGKKAEADELFGLVWGAYAKMLADYPDSTAARNSAAWLAANCRREPDAALEYAEGAVKADPRSNAYRETLAEVHFRRGDRDKALEIMAALADEAPRSRPYRRQLIRYRTGDPATSIPETETE